MSFWDYAVDVIPGLVNGIANVFSTTQANESNLQMTRETNEANRLLNERNIEVARQNWAKESAYNTPAAQLARLRQAGINVDGSLIPATGGSIQNVNTHPYQSPPAVQPIPYGGVISDALKSISDIQGIQETDMQLYKSGIDKITYLREKLNQIRQQELEIAGKETLNEQDKERLAILRSEAESIDRKISKEFRSMDDAHKESRKKQKLIDMQAKDVYAGILREDKRLLENVAHMKREDRINYVNAQTLRFNAQTNRIEASTHRLVARAEVRKLEDESAMIVQNLIHAQNEESRRKVTFELERRLNEMNLDQKEVMLRLLEIEYENAEDKNKSVIRHAIEQVAGVDVGSFLQGAGSIWQMIGK